MREWLCVAVACVGLGFAATAERPAEHALRSGEDPAEALAAAEAALEDDPDSCVLLEQASRAAEAAGRTDHALWYADLALDACLRSGDKDAARLADGLRARMVTLDPLKGQGAAALADYENTLVAVGGALARRKMVVSAVSLLTRVRGAAARDKAESELERIYKDKKAVAALLESGVDVPIQEKKRKGKSPEQLAADDKKHEDWDKAWELKGDQYTIRTNMPLKSAEAFLSAMEQMNRFYRKFFRVKESGGSTARVTIHVYRSRAEFDLYERDADGKPKPAGVKGFFSPSELKVVTYDTRDDGFPASFLWSTLFHEASHQFTHIALPAGAEPTWLNEGTASYFEGARMLPNGTVECNLVADLRLDELKDSLEGGKPTLEDVISYDKRGSYPGEYYPFGWGLVYFFHNYRDEKSKLPYVEPYRAYMLAYKSGAKHDFKERFVEYFVTKAKQPGVATFEDFEQRWKKWIHELHGLWFGEPEVADTLLARARVQEGHGELDAAEETYLWALRKRPDDPSALVELGEVLEAQKRPDPALARYRRAIEVLRAVEDESAALPGSGELTAKDLIDVCAQRIVRIDKNAAEALTKADAKLLADAAAQAAAYADAGLPLVALTLLDDAARVYGVRGVFGDTAQGIVNTSGADPRRWRRVRADEQLTAWSADEGWTARDGGLAVETERLAYAFLRDDPPERYRFEIEVDVSKLGDEGILMLAFGSNDQGMQLVGVTGGGLALVAELDEGFKTKKPLPSVKPDQRSALRITVDVDGDDAEFFFGERSVGKLAYKTGQLRGSVGLAVQSGSATVKSVRLRY